MYTSAPASGNGRFPLSILISILLLASFSACRQKTAEAGVDEPDTVSSGSPDIPAPQGSLPIAGTWISQEYLEDLRRTGSPRKAQTGSEEVMAILPDNSAGTVTLHYFFHELVPDLHVEPNGEKYRLAAPDGPSYDLVRTDDGIKINGRPFVRYPVPFENGLPRIVEQEIFEGMYQLPDGQRVTFDAQGRVRGLGTHKHYLPRLDYFDEGLDVDQVGLGPSPDNITWYGFAVRKDELVLYHLRCKKHDKADGRCIETAFGAPAYTLTKTQSSE